MSDWVLRGMADSNERKKTRIKSDQRRVGWQSRMPPAICVSSQGRNSVGAGWMLVYSVRSGGFDGPGETRRGRWHRSRDDPRREDRREERRRRRREMCRAENQKSGVADGRRRDAGVVSMLGNKASFFFSWPLRVGRQGAVQCGA